MEDCMEQELDKMRVRIRVSSWRSMEERYRRKMKRSKRRS